MTSYGWAPIISVSLYSPGLTYYAEFWGPFLFSPMIRKSSVAGSNTLKSLIMPLEYPYAPNEEKRSNAIFDVISTSFAGFNEVSLLLWEVKFSSYSTSDWLPYCI